MAVIYFDDWFLFYEMTQTVDLLLIYQFSRFVISL